MSHLTEIEIRPRSSDWHAQIKDHPGIWGCGKTIDDAIGSLVRSWPEKFGIKIQFPDPIGKLPDS